MTATIGQRIKATRESLGISLSQLAEMAGCTKSYLHEIEHASEYDHTSRIGALKLYKIADALGCSMEYLMRVTELPRQNASTDGNNLAIKNMMLTRRLRRIRAIAAGTDTEE